MATEEQTLQDGWNARVGTANIHIGQKLPTTVTRSISALSFLLKRTGSPGGTVTFRILRVSDGVELGSKLLGNANDIATSITWHEVTFDSAVETIEEARIVCNPSAGATSNFIATYLKQSDVTAHGQFTRFSNGWIDSPSADCAFKYTYTDITQTPVVTTQAVSSIEKTTAIGNGNITTLGKPLPTQHGHCWSTSPSPTTSDDKTENGVPSATGAFTSNLTGLLAGTFYYVRAYIINSLGTYYGSEVTFTTLSLSRSQAHLIG